jgi:hypothetical protein
MPLTVSPAVSNDTRAYAGSSSIGPEISATHLPEISAAAAPRAHIKTPPNITIAIQRIRIVIVLLIISELRLTWWQEEQKGIFSKRWDILGS